MVLSAMVLLSCTCMGLPADEPVESSGEVVDTVDEILQSWRRAEKNLATLEVDYVVKDLSPFGGVDAYKFSLKLSRSRDGNVLAWLEMLGGITLIRGNTIHDLSPADKVAFTMNLTRSEVRECVSQGYTPATLFLDQKSLGQKWRIKFAKEDEWYVYLDFFPKRSDLKARFQRARVVVLKNDFPTLPKHAPRQIWIQPKDGSESLIVVQQWQMNHKIKPTQFRLPSMKGWRVGTFDREPTWEDWTNSEKWQTK